MLEISDLVARRCKAESGICFKNRLKRGEVTHEKSGGNTGVSGVPHEGSGGLCRCYNMVIRQLKTVGNGLGGFIRRQAMVHEASMAGP